VRTTLTLDPDVATRLNAEASRTDRALKVVVNDALRRGLRLPVKSARIGKFQVKPLRLMFRPGIDADKLNELADELENDALVKKMRR
jgi:hypothetical protein